MNVYLVTYDYFTTYTLGIFSTRDKAEQEIANFRKHQMTWGFHVPTDDDIQIDEIPLDINLELCYNTYCKEGVAHEEQEEHQVL